MATEPLHIFDPRRTMHVQGFSGRAATTTIHDVTETSLSISGIFQAVQKTILHYAPAPSVEAQYSIAGS